MPKISKYNGGYVIISLNDEDIYEKIERNLYKPILLTDIVINGIEKNDVFTTAYVEGTNIVFKDIYDKDITISNDNSVTYYDSYANSIRISLRSNNFYAEGACDTSSSFLRKYDLYNNDFKKINHTIEELDELLSNLGKFFNLNGYYKNGNLIEMAVLYNVSDGEVVTINSTTLNESAYAIGDLELTNFYITLNR